MNTDSTGFSAVTLQQTTENLIPSFRECLDVVARGRVFLAFTQAPPLEKMVAYFHEMQKNNGVQFLALDKTQVVGWCDISPLPWEGFRHTGRLGMGLLPDYRSKGIGKQLMLTTIEEVRQRGVERIELDVFQSNLQAISLYEKFGFVVEGVRRRVRKLEGVYEDAIFMALLIDLSKPFVLKGHSEL